MTWQELYGIVQQRSSESADQSYTARLLESGVDRIAQKVGEEAVEVVIAAKNDDKGLLIGEVSDLIYHLSVLLYAKGITLNDVFGELERRHEEKTK